MPDASDPPVTSIAALHALLADVSLGPWFAAGWDWTARGENLEQKGWFLRLAFRAPDRDSGKVGMFCGRWWWIEAPATESAVVKTAWLAVHQVVEHELMESFRFRGARPFDPHRTIAELVGERRSIS